MQTKKNKFYEDIYQGINFHFRGCTLIFRAAQFKTVTYLRFILNFFSENGMLFGNYGINYQNDEGNTALHLSCKKGHKPHIKLLIDYGADISIKNNKGKSPVDCSKKEIGIYVMEVYDNLLDIKEPSE